MKRSEMIEILNNIIYECQEEMCIPTANYILKTIEEAGMSPPINEDKSFRMIKGEMTYEVREWDEE